MTDGGASLANVVARGLGTVGGRSARGSICLLILSWSLGR